MEQWKDIAAFPPPEDTPVRTKIDTVADGVRNETLLRKRGNLWWFADGSMYVYYTPTHWKYSSAG